MSDLSENQRVVYEMLPATKTEIADRVGTTEQGAKSYIKRIRRNGYEIDYDRSTQRYHTPDQQPHKPASELPRDAIKDSLNQGIHLSELIETHDTTEGELRQLFSEFRENGVQISQTGDESDPIYHIPKEWDREFSLELETNNLTFGLISDTHLGSSTEHLQELQDYYDRAEQEGITDIFHCGDISDGWKVHKGHINEIKGEAAGWGRLKNYVVENYPQRDGITTHFIEGNHDNKYFNRSNIHFGRLIANQRDDLHYLGNSQATIYLDRENDIDLELIHPSGGKPYTTAYRLQTLYRERNMENRPTIAGVGHLHGSVYAETEGVKGLYAGAWKGTTTYGKRKGHQAKIGGWILDVTISNGRVSEFVPKWVGYEENKSENNYDL